MRTVSRSQPPGMTMRLAVELYGCVIGILEGDARTFDFAPADEGIERFGSNSPVLSVAIPLASVRRRDHASRRRNWFAELLPEGDPYEYMLAQASLRRGDTLAFLARFGHDVAGALQIWDLDDPTEPRLPSLRPVTAPQIRALLEDPIGAPLGNAAVQGRTSLGEVQPKIALMRNTDPASRAASASRRSIRTSRTLPGWKPWSSNDSIDSTECECTRRTSIRRWKRAETRSSRRSAPWSVSRGWPLSCSGTPRPRSCGTWQR